MIVILDKETSTFNKGHPHDARNKLVSFSVKKYGENPVFHYYTDPDFLSSLCSAIQHATRLVGFNLKFDLGWYLRLGYEIPPDLEIWDCQLAEFIYTGQEARFASLDGCLEKYNLPLKKDVVKEYWDKGISTEDIPFPILEEYNNWDVCTTEMLYDVQQNLLSEKQQKLVLVEGEDMKTLLAAEHAGIKFNTKKALQTRDDLQQKLSSIEAQMAACLPPDIPPAASFNFDSGDQLSALLYGGTITYKWAKSEPAVYKSGAKEGQEYIRNTWHSTEVVFPRRFQPLDGTEVKKTEGKTSVVTRFYQVDEPTLKQLKTKDKQSKELISLFLTRAKIGKVAEMIQSIHAKMVEKNWQDDYIHAQFNQNVVVTGRLSSSQPNLQNTPPEIDEFLVSRYC